MKEKEQIKNGLIENNPNWAKYFDVNEIIKDAEDNPKESKLVRELSIILKSDYWQESRFKIINTVIEWVKRSLDRRHTYYGRLDGVNGAYVEKYLKKIEHLHNSLQMEIADVSIDRKIPVELKFKFDQCICYDSIIANRNTFSSLNAVKVALKKLEHDDDCKFRIEVDNHLEEIKKCTIQENDDEVLKSNISIQLDQKIEVGKQLMNGNIADWKRLSCFYYLSRRSLENLRSVDLISSSKKPKKPAAKYYALLHWVRIENNDEAKFEKNFDEKWPKTKMIEVFSKKYKGVSPVMIYQAFKDFDITDKNAIVRSLPDCKRKISIASENDANVNHYLKDWPN